MLSSIEFFNRLANGGLADHYHERSRYREAVDSVVLRHAPEKPRMLDVGSGTGERALKLSYALEAESTTLCDSSPEMATRAEATTILCSAEDLFWKPELHGQFDLITCLGNVVGHTSLIHMAIASFHKLLRPNGVVVFDVNNRYNVREYGLKNVVRNVCKDWIGRPLDNGYFLCKQGEFETKVRLHMKDEVEALLYDGMSRVALYYLDYRTGQRRRTQWGGQMVYVLKKGPSLRSSLIRQIRRLPDTNLII